MGGQGWGLWDQSGRPSLQQTGGQTAWKSHGVGDKDRLAFEIDPSLVCAPCASLEKRDILPWDVLEPVLLKNKTKKKNKTLCEARMGGNQNLFTILPNYIEV